MTILFDDFVTAFTPTDALKLRLRELATLREQQAADRTDLDSIDEEVQRTMFALKASEYAIVRDGVQGYTEGYDPDKLWEEVRDEYPIQ